MATKLQGTLLKSSIGVDKIKKSVMSFNKSINSTQKTAMNINTSLANSNRQKQQAIRLSVSNFQKRREAVRRREREDIIEASGVGGAIKRQGKVISSSTKGFLGRILDFIGTLMVGWLLNNLPAIISLGEQLIDRMRRLYIVLRSFVGNLTTILSGFGSLLTGTFRNLISFDFSTQKQLLDNSLSTIQSGMLGLEGDFNRAIDLLSEPLDLGFDSIDIPEGEDRPEPAAPEGVPSSGGDRWKPLFDAIGAGEGGYTSMYPGENYPELVNMTIAQVIQFQKQKLKDGRASAAVGKYQMLYPEKYAAAAGLPLTAKFSPENQDRMAGAYIEKYRGGSDWLAGKITDEQFGYQLAKEFAGLKQPNGVGFYDKDGRNKATVDWKVTKAALKKVKSQPATPSPVITSKSRVIDEINVSGPSGGTPTVGLSGGGGNYGAYRTSTRSHAGIDIGTSGQRGWLVGFRSSGTVTYAGTAGGYGNLVIIKSGTTEYYFAHLARIFVKLGPYNGEVIGEIGNTGYGSGIHLHYEVRPNGRPIDPKPYLNLLDIGRKTAAPQTAAKPASTPAMQIANAKPASTQAATQITAERKGQTIVVPIPDQSQIAQAPASYSRGGGISIPTGDTSGLNRYIEQSQYFILA